MKNKIRQWCPRCGLEFGWSFKDLRDHARVEHGVVLTEAFGRT